MIGVVRGILLQVELDIRTAIYMGRHSTLLVFNQYGDEHVLSSRPSDHRTNCRATESAELGECTG
jgi:hypothetical protein